MKIKYEFANGETSEVEVDDEIGAFIVDSRRVEHNAEERDRYHSVYSVENLYYEGDILVADSTPEADVINEEGARYMLAILSCLTPVQRRRFTLHAEGKTYREIAESEGVQLKAIQDSVEQARKKLAKFF